MTLPIWTDEQVKTQLFSGNKWNGLAISFAFPTNTSGLNTSEGEGAGFGALNTTQKYYAALNIELWDDLISPSIFRIYTGLSDIEFGMSNRGVDYAHAYYPVVGTVWFNHDKADLEAPKIGDYGFSTYIHETGHALGLDHAGDYNGNSSWTPLYYQDSTVYSIMSYFGPDHDNGNDLVALGNWIDKSGVAHSPQTPMLNDVMAIQAIYGADHTTRSKNTTYGFSSDVSKDGLNAIYDFSINKNPILCIYDAGGIDTLNLTDWNSNSVVSLIPGALSSCNGMTNNLSIARNTVIENLATGNGDDILIGNEVNNYLDAGSGNDLILGGLGNDTLAGGAGLDTAEFNFGIENYLFQYVNSCLSISDQTTNRDGMDQLDSIELIKFTNWSGSLLEEHASNQNQLLTFEGRFSEYQVAGDQTSAIVVDHEADRNDIRLLNGYTRLYFDDYKVGLDYGRGENAGMVYRLYKAAFDRTPDLPGLGHWIRLNDYGYSIEWISNEFVKSKEFELLYGANNSDVDFINLLYRNALNRESEPEGLNNWVNALTPQGGWTRAQVLNFFSESDENWNQTQELVINGVQYL